jgi:hypothetical protein
VRILGTVGVQQRQAAHGNIQRDVLKVENAFFAKTAEEAEQMDLLWGFALNPKPGTQGSSIVVEVGFSSGAVNRARLIGVTEGADGSVRTNGILNRTTQKKVIEYLKSSSYLEGYKNIELKDGLSGKDIYW